MRLKLKIVYLIENSKKWVLQEWGFIFSLDLGVIFLGIQIFEDLRFRKKFFKKVQILGIIEKCIGWVLVYPFLGVFFH